MTALCPRCGTPRVGDFCHICGLDFRTLASPTPKPVPAPAAAPAPAPVQPPSRHQPAPEPHYYRPVPQAPGPANCARCGAPLYAGSPQCPNCGFDTRGSWAPQTGMAPARRSVMPIALALLGVSCLVVAAALFVVVQSRGPAAAASPSPSAVAVATPTPTQTPMLEPTPSPSAVDPNGTPEPSPEAAWTSFTAPDGKWMTSFPGAIAPTKRTNPIGTGSTAMTQIIYSVSTGGTAYAVTFVDLPASMIAGQTPDALLTTMQVSMTSSLNGTDVVSEATAEGGYAARDVAMNDAGSKINMRIWFVGTRFYMLLVSHASGLVAYPQHFFAAFSLK